MKTSSSLFFNNLSQRANMVCAGALLAFLVGGASVALRADSPPANVLEKSPPNVWWTGSGTGGWLDASNWRWEGTPAVFPNGSDMWVGFDTSASNKSIDVIYNGASALSISVDHIRYYGTGYSMNIQGAGGGRITFEFTGLGIVRDNTTGGSNVNPVNDIPVHIKENATLKYSGAAQAGSGFWNNRASRVYLDTPTSELDFSAVTGAYSVGMIQSVEGSTIKLADSGGSTTTNIAFGDAGVTNRIAGLVLGGSGSNSWMSKAGSGFMYFTGTLANNRSGRFTVAGGALVVNGYIDSNVRLEGGSLMGSGTITGNVDLVSAAGASFISPGADANEVGDLKIGGNLTLNIMNTYVVDLSGTGANARADKLVVGGTTSWNNAYLKVKPSKDFEMVAGQFVIIESGTLNPAALYQSDGKNLIDSLTLKAQLQQDGKNLVLRLDQQQFSNPAILPGLNENQQAIAAHVDRLVASGGDGVNIMLSSLNRVSSMNSMRYAFSQVAPMALRTWYPSQVLLGADIADNLSERRSTPLENGDGKWEIFAGASYMSMGFDQTADSDGATANAWRAMGGVSYTFNPKIKAGLFYSKDNIDTDCDGFGGTTKIDGSSYGVFAEYGNGRLRISGAAFMGSDDYESRRSLSLVGGGLSRGDTSGERIGGTIDASYNFKVKSWGVAPFAGLQYLDWSVDEFTETTSSLPLTVGSQDASSLLGKLGVRLTTKIQLLSRMFHPFANVGYKRELGDSEYTMRVRQGGSSYNVKVDDPSGGLFVRGGFDVDLGRGFTAQVSAGYDDNIHTSDNYSFFGSLGCRF